MSDKPPCTFPTCGCDLENNSGRCGRDKIGTTPKRLLSTLTSAERKTYPIATGFLDYFPDATAMVAHVSYLGNQKHNPGQPLHWSRAKSNDHADCEVRHMIERGARDPEGILHSAEKAWRAMADLQIEIEKAYGLDPPRSAVD